MEGCNHTSVGVLVEQNGKILLIERKNFPFGYALPAGHVDDGEEYDAAARRELEEEVGLRVILLELIGEGRKEYPCGRGSTWHYWKIYKATTEGDVKRSEEETKQVGWYSREEIKKLSNPGLDPVMGVWFKELGII